MIDNKLITLLTVIETKSYSEASKKLNLTQPAVSQHISQLEKEYEIKIFNRVNSQLLLTNEGQILEQFARRNLSLYKDLKTKLNDQKLKTNTLTVGITHSQEGSLIPLLCAKYCEENPGSHIKIISDTIKNLYEKLSLYEIDIAIIDGKVNSNKFSSVSLDTDSLVAVISNNNSLSKKEIININDIKKEKLLLRPSTSATRILFERQLENINVSIDDFNITLELDNIAAIKDLIEKDYGISVLPKSVCIQEIKNHSLSMRPIENMTMIREVNLVYRKDSIEPHLLNNLIKLYHEL